MNNFSYCWDVTVKSQFSTVSFVFYGTSIEVAIECASKYPGWKCFIKEISKQKYLERIQEETKEHRELFGLEI